MVQLNMLTPKDNDFWFELSADVVKYSFSRLNDAAGKLYNFVAWFFPIFTGSTILSFAINKPNEVLIYITPIPYVLLTLGLSKAISAQIPVASNFIWNVPLSIEKAYMAAFATKVSKLRQARWWVSFGVIASAVILFYSFVLSRKNQLEAIKENYFETSYSEGKAAKDFVAVTGHLLPSVPVNVQGVFYNQGARSETVMFTTHFMNSDDGDFNKSFVVPKVKVSGKYYISIEWKESGYKKALTREITISK